MSCVGAEWAAASAPSGRRQRLAGVKSTYDQACVFPMTTRVAGRVLFAGGAPPFRDEIAGFQRCVS